MNAESLVEDGLGLIREIMEQNALNPLSFPGLIEKNGQVECISPEFPVQGDHIKDTLCKKIGIRIQFIR